MGMGSDIIKKRLLTLFLDCLKLRNFHTIVKNVAAVDAHGYVYYPNWIRPIYWYVLFGVYISAWASALLVQQWWAMRRPQAVGRVTVQTLTLFFCAYFFLANHAIWEPMVQKYNYV
jgi:hypothetical protein